MSCYRCEKLFEDPIMQAPCGHILCKQCLGLGKCNECELKIFQCLEVKLVRDMVESYKEDADAIKEFTKSKE